MLLFGKPLTSSFYLNGQEKNTDMMASLYVGLIISGLFPIYLFSRLYQKHYQISPYRHYQYEGISFYLIQKKELNIANYKTKT